MNRWPLYLIVVLQGLVLGNAHAQTSATPETTLSIERIIEQAKSRVFPALVFVKPIREDYETGERTRQEVFGSGVIISPTGLVVTNNHVAEKAVQINCVLYDKRQVQAKIVGLDPETDLALLKLELPPQEGPLPYAVFADSSRLDEGQFVMALGSPFGFSRSISMGIISNTQRYIGFNTLYKFNNWIQTDAAINPGNSGGPLVDTRGRVVGINTLGISDADNLGFAIPSNVVREVVAGLERNGRIIRSWTGLVLQALKDFATNTFTEANSGVLIQDVEENSPAADAGLHAGDILVSVDGIAIDGTYVENLPEIRRLLAQLPVDHDAIFRVRRGGGFLEYRIHPVLKGSVEGEDFDCRRWNMTVKVISKYLNPDLYFLRKEGVYVQGVRYPGNAQMAGLQMNDILLSINRREIQSLGDVKRIYQEILADENREKKVLVEVLRGGYRNWFVLDYRKNWEEEE